MPPSPPPPSLQFLPSRRLMCFIVSLDGAASTLYFLPPARLLDGLRTARALLGFDGLHRADDVLDELLPWAGSV